MFEIISSQYYHLFFLIFMGVLVFFQELKLLSIDNTRLLYKENNNNNYVPALLLSVFLIFFFGTRDPYSVYFADTLGYAGRYDEIKEYGTKSVFYKMLIGQSAEMIWSQIIISMAMAKIDVSVWFTLVACLYIFPILYALKKIFPNQLFLACIFAFLNFGFYGGAINGIRNGVGLSLILLALALFITNRNRRYIPCLLLLIAYEFHSSTILPSLCLLGAIYIIKDAKLVVRIWISSIIISILFGNSFILLFESWGFDDRLYSYVNSGEANANWGFRLDFLIFSAVPVIWGWWIINKLRYKDRAYNIIFNTYVLANSFWVLVIRASFSNRFAALSWFLYFLVLIYPLLKKDLFPLQGQTLAIILIGLYLINIVI